VAIFEPDSDVITGPKVPGAPQEPVLEVDEIQGAVMPGFGTPFQHLLGLRFADAGTARDWLADRFGDVSSLAEVNAGRNLRRRALRDDQPRPHTPPWAAVTLSADGLRLFGRDPRAVEDTAFEVGMAARAGLLGDPLDPAREGHPSHWVVGGSTGTTPHTLLILGAETEAELVERAAAARVGGDVVFEQRGRVLPGDKEHFGFRDGVSHIAARGRLSDASRHFLSRRWIDPADERARIWARPGQSLVWPGQFVFGYPAQRRDDALQPGAQVDGAAPWVRNGSLLAFRRLRQDVARFRTFTAQASAELRAQAGFDQWTPERFAAALVGRWPDGTALLRSPAAPDPAALDDMLAANYFDFAATGTVVEVCADPKVAAEALADVMPGVAELRPVSGTPADPFGDYCPRFAHIRKVNPRDLATDQGGPDATLPIQVLRRGITWGAAYADGEPDEAADRGLLFMCWQTSIVNQFELLNSRWMNAEHAPEGNAGHDLLVGQAPVRRCTFSGSNGATRLVETDQSWVVPTGGGYFFAPSLSELCNLAETQP
jgi:Dyp-type peroxidase family